VAKSLWRPTENNAAENDVAENTHPDNDDNDESTANLGTPFPSSITSIVTVPTSTNRRESIMGFTPTLRPAFTNYTPTDSDTDAEDDFVLRHARGRLVYVRRALLRLEDQWGAVDRWAARFVQQWPTMKTESAPRVASWFASVRHQAQMGRHIIQDLARVMDGEMPSETEWRDIWLEAYQLLGMLYAGVLGLELRLDIAERWHGGDHFDIQIFV
jgi:hypothetical protein